MKRSAENDLFFDWQALYEKTQSKRLEHYYCLHGYFLCEDTKLPRDIVNSVICPMVYIIGETIDVTYFLFEQSILPTGTVSVVHILLDQSFILSLQKLNPSWDPFQLGIRYSDIVAIVGKKGPLANYFLSITKENDGCKLTFSSPYKKERYIEIEGSEFIKGFREILKSAVEEIEKQYENEYSNNNSSIDITMVLNK
jgi:hypothetical protein